MKRAKRAKAAFASRVSVPALTAAFFIFTAVGDGLAAGPEADTQLEPIVVQKTPYGSLSRGPVVEVLTREEIDGLPLQTPEDLLNYVGADLQTRGGAGVKSDLTLNGSTFQQVLILVNGARVNDPQTAHHGLDLTFNLEDVERVEVLPSAAAALYGPDGIGGAINFVLKRPLEGQNSARASVGNYDTFEESLNLYYPLGGIARNRFSVAAAESDGERYDTDFRQATFFHSTSIEKEAFSVFVDGGYNEKEFGAYDFYTPDRGLPSKEWVNTTFVDVRAPWRGEGVTVEPRVQWRQHHDKFMLDITRPDYYLNHTRTDVYQVGAQATAPWAHGDMLVGADFGQEMMTSTYLGDHDRDRWDVFFNPVWEIGPAASLQVAARYDSYSTFGGEPTGALSWQQGFSDDSQLFFSAGRAVRVPTFTELYYDDPTTSGNENLKPESAYSVELGGRRPLTQTLDGSFSVFTRWERDTIDFTKEAPTDPKFIARNISEAITNGLRGSLTWTLSSDNVFTAGYSFATKDLDDRGYIYKYGLNYAKHLVDLGWNKRFSWGNNRAQLLMKKKPERDAWLLFNDRVTVSPWKHWEVFLEVFNLFNVEYQEIDGVPSPGRIFKAGVAFVW